MEADVVIYDEVWQKYLKRDYKTELSLVRSGREKSIHIRVAGLPEKLYQQVLDAPVLAADYIRAAFPGLVFSVRFVNLPKKTDLANLCTDKLGVMCAIDGTVRSIQDTKPYISTAAFRCTNCNQVTYIKQTEKLLERPESVSCCNKPKLVLDVEKCDIVDSQIFKVQDGANASKLIEVLIFGDICGLLSAGDRLIVNGILKSYRANKDTLSLSLYFEGNSIEVTDREFSEVSISDEDEKKILEMSRRDDLLSQFVQAIAPTIRGHTNVKEAVALQLFGGSSVKYEDGTTKRGDIHVLLVGDPGVSKSKLLQSVKAICPRGILVSGKGSSTAGLTASAVKDAEGVWTLEAGAVVLADQGQLLIDEVDKMTDEDSSSLHQAMEQQQISIAKAGVVRTLNTRCSILAAMNPKLGRFDTFGELAEQINLPPTLLSRFDLIFLLVDSPGESDREIANHILNGSACVTDIAFLRKYIAYAKRISPVAGEDAKRKITEYYCEIRALVSRGKSVPLTARQLESLVRLAEAHAKMRLSQEISIEDAETAIRILDGCLRGVAYDPKTGALDIDRVATTMSHNSREKAKDMLSICRDLVQEYPMGFLITDICAKCPLKSKSELEDELERLQDNKMIYKNRHQRYNIL